MKNKVTVGIVMMGLGLSSVLLGGCQKEEVVAADARPLVEVASPEKIDIEVYTSLIGTIEPKTTAMVLPKMAGEIEEINFSAGDYVTKGQVLCRIHSDALDTLKINVDAAAVTKADTERALARIQALSETGAVSQSDLEQAQSAATGAALQYEAAKTNYDLQLEYTTVLAPMDGVVESRSVDLHDMVSPSAPVCVISTMEQNMVKFGVTEKVMKNLRTGDELTLERDGIIYHASITEIGTMAEMQSGLYQVWAAVEDGDSLTTGARAKLDVVMDHAEQVMAVPLDAVYYDNGEPFVYVYAEGTANRVDVETGIHDDEWMEITDGLSAGSTVITTWSNEVFDGAAVLVSETEMDMDEITDEEAEVERIDD